ncbi:MAG: hypothetical protein CL848_04855 [Crocinitomicaceae bacterium]|nr:hypothetical protein [Crocinitomicaceae bacterium]
MLVSGVARRERPGGDVGRGVERVRWRLARFRLGHLADAHRPLGRAPAAVGHVGVRRARVLSRRKRAPHEPILADGVCGRGAAVVRHVRARVLEQKRKAPLAARVVGAVVALAAGGPRPAVPAVRPGAPSRLAPLVGGLEDAPVRVDPPDARVGAV